MLAHYKKDLDAKDTQCLRLIAYRGSVGLNLGRRAGRMFRDVAFAYSLLKEPAKSGARIQYMMAILDIGYLTPKEMSGAERRTFPTYRVLTRDLLRRVISRYTATRACLADLKMIEKIFSMKQGEMPYDQTLPAYM